MPMRGINSHAAFAALLIEFKAQFHLRGCAPPSEMVNKSGKSKSFTEQTLTTYSEPERSGVPAAL